MDGGSWREFRSCQSGRQANAHHLLSGARVVCRCLFRGMKMGEEFHDLLAITKFKNLLFHELKGDESFKELSQRIGVSASALGMIMNLKHWPFLRNGEPTPIAKKIAAYF